MLIGIIGANGRIGRAVAEVAARFGHDTVRVDAGDDWTPALEADATVATCPDPWLAMKWGAKAYFDVSEGYRSPAVARECAELFPDRLYVPNCGLAPGAANIIAAHQIRVAKRPKACDIYVGALPADRRVGYAISWSAEGLHKIYVSDVAERVEGRTRYHEPLQAFELVNIDRETFEAFTTSGGTGTLCSTFPALERLRYKTLRYPGHYAELKKMLECEYPRAAMEHAWPPHHGPDRVFMLIRVEEDGRPRDTYQNEIEPTYGLTAIQYATAVGVVAAVEATVGMTGFLKQEDIPYDLWLKAARGVY